MSKVVDDSREKIKAASEEFCRYCRLVYDRRLVTGMGGNMSARVGHDTFLTLTSAEEIDEAAKIHLLTMGKGSVIPEADVCRIV